ncbi:DeoR/GlpR family DNA-binding transcription regulator [Actinocorallia sp. API 0066]|uniref:DeoR/GlpR family DNA-binding transcription regulator n=1 Tax=Actinocorallia sp. API 0066 TaxID=2896846 RepID=UPI001E367057|nr:DeoR/GlpR family DNA-binding transcription regulator [Actinocorallia sp. API 0066]MCD0448028.1 DeoR/GlpR family DNA-binding transcription regulator [Actinocorallia sp. API 0066]
MNRDERLSAVLELVAERGRVDVDEVVGALGVSAATVRRDLDQLARQRLLTRTRGGAVANGVAVDLPMRYRTARNAEQKERIAHEAARLVTRGMVVGLNGGTTTTRLAAELATRADLTGSAQEPAFTVVTNALNIAYELTVRPQVKVVVTGGVERPQSYELIGPLATRILQDVSLDVAFLGVDAVDPEAGATAHHEGEASINQLLASRARRVVVVADSSKLGGRAFARICGMADVDVLITDTGAPSDVVARFAERDVEVRTV